jgi:ribonuclease T1
MPGARPLCHAAVVIRRRLAAALLGVAALAGCATATMEVDAAGPGGTSTQEARYADLAPAAATSDLPTMAVGELPPEGVETLELIADGGPFPYDKDGSTFQNREGILPDRPSGFYGEYTVITPGEGDRGARRIVAGDDGSRFYTADHYNSFREVVSG